MAQTNYLLPTPGIAPNFNGGWEGLPNTGMRRIVKWFQASTTFQIPPDVDRVFLRASGGGGGGGTPDYGSNGGGGGGAAQCAVGMLFVIPTLVYTVTIGAGGAGGAANSGSAGHAGSPGGTTQFSHYGRGRDLILTGGFGGDKLNGGPVSSGLSIASVQDVLQLVQGAAGGNGQLTGIGNAGGTCDINLGGLSLGNSNGGAGGGSSLWGRGGTGGGASAGGSAPADLFSGAGGGGCSGDATSGTGGVGASGFIELTFDTASGDVL